MRTVFAFSAIALAAALAGAPTQSHAQAPLAWPYSEFAKSESSNTGGTRAKRERSRSEASENTTSRRKRASEDRYASSDEDRPQRRGRTARSSGGGSSDGLASYYWQPQRVASGGWFNPDALTAAHKTLPFGTKVRVTNSGNGKSVVVTINDRGPYVGGRVIDLSRAAAGAISMQSQGVAPVRLEVLGR